MKLSTLLGVIGLAGLLIGLSACGAGGDPPGGSNPNQADVVVQISPKSVFVQLGAQRQFDATASDGGGITWSVQQGAQYGTIDSQGLYSAPGVFPPTNNATIVATSVSDPTKSDSANVTLQSAPVFGAFPIQFDVGTQDNWQALAAPATVGIPFQRGLHTDASTLQLVEQGGTQVGAQFKVTSRWDDGSIRWLLVDFIADMSAANGIGSYEVDLGGSGSATGTNLNVTDGATAITVATGLLEFTVSKTAFRLFESIRIDRDNDGQVDDECLDTGAMRGIVINDGTDQYTMDRVTPTSITVEEQGPIRVTIRAEGVHQNALGTDILNWVARITAWNDQPHIKVQYSFRNMDGDGVSTASHNDAAQQLRAVAEADSVYFDLPFDFQTTDPSARLGGSGGLSHATGVMNSAEYAELLQNYTGTHDAADPENLQPAAYNSGTGEGSSDQLTNTWADQAHNLITYDVSGKISANGDGSAGWAQMAGSGLQVTAVVRDFWQQYPKSLRVQGDGLLRMGIWPELSSWKLQVFAGAMKTHDMLLSFNPIGSTNENTAESRANIINDPPFGVCDPRHYAATRVFGEIATTDVLLQDDSYFRNTSKPFAANYMDEVIAHFGGILFDRDNSNGGSGHEYGMWHWGDGKHTTPVEGWENNDWGITRAALQWFAASGNRGLFALADVTARHFRDVDVLHANIGMRFDYSEPGNPAVSSGKASQIGKTRFFPNNKQHDLGAYRADGDPGLDVFKGGFLATHYLLTGDALSLDVLKEIYTYLRGTWKRHFDSGNGGQDTTLDCPPTWLANGLLIATAYEMANGDNDPSAATMVNFVVDAIKARQSNVTPNDPAGAGFADTSGDFKAWELGILMEALEYARWNSNDPTIDGVILTGMNWLTGTNANVYLGQLNPPQPGEYAESPNGTTDFGGPNLMIGAGYIGAFRSSGSNNWQALGDNLVNVQTQNIEAGVAVGDDDIRHRSFAQFFRAGPHLLATLKQ